MKRYDPKIIEPKWQQIWAETKLYAAKDGDKTREKFYMLTEFPYPSGAGLHSGHAREYTLGDVIARHKRMLGYNVMYPMGYDAFGLPTENYAIKHKMRPQDATAENVATFRKQLDSMGLGIDWDREVNTTDPSYYKWTQWLFLRFLEKGLAYQAEMPINWCPKEKTGLANEEVVNGLHERCGTPVEKKLLKQWMLRITDYADRLIEGLHGLDFPPRIADQQVNWIGRSEGAEIEFAVGGSERKPADSLKFTPELTTLVVSGEKTSTIRLEAKDLKMGDYAKLITRFSAKETRAFAMAKITKVEKMALGDVPLDLEGHEPFSTRAEMLAAYRGYYGNEVALNTKFTIYHFELAEPIVTVYTTRPDTLAGATFLVLAPEHPAVARVTTDKQRSAVEAYAKRAQSESEVDRQETAREKTGVWTGAYAKNPISGRDMPVWVADYVLSGYGTGAIMAVPAHDERDGVFARKFELPVERVVAAPEARYLVIERSLPEMAVARLPEFGEVKIESANEAWGRFFRISVSVEREPDFVKFLSNNLLETSSDGGSWYADSVGSSNIVVFFGRIIDLNKPGGWNGFIAEGRRRGIPEEQLDIPEEKVAYTGPGPLINSGQFDGLAGTEAKRAVTKWLFEQGIGRGATKFKLRDWIFSRQHYWGEPIPVIHCDKCGVVPVPTNQLPVTLPDVDNYEPTDSGESPLAAISQWVNTTCPKCGGVAKRETDTMPNWAGSSWYWLRYMDAHNDREFAARDKLEYWGMVDLYLGGMEHTTLHLLYSRFWHEFLYDEGLVPTPEPYAARRGQGIVLAADGRKMSKSIGNVVNPTDVIEKYGADALRLYMLFMAPYDEATAWSDERLSGVSRFVWRVWGLAQELLDAHEVVGPVEENTGEFALAVDRAVHKATKKVHDDLHELKFNTAVAALMELVNYLAGAETKARLALPENAAVARRAVRQLVLLLAPLTPHMAEEIWHDLGEPDSVHVAPWPEYDPELIKDELVTVIVQVNGKLRGQIIASPEDSDDELVVQAKAEPNVAKYLAEGQIVKTVVVPRRLVNFVVK